MRHVECSVCKEVHKSALTDVHELCYTISYMHYILSNFTEKVENLLLKLLLSSERLSSLLGSHFSK